MADDENCFVLNVYYDGDWDTDDAVTEALKGNKYGMRVADGETYVDISDTTNTVFEVVDIYPPSIAGDIRGRVLVKVLRDVGAFTTKTRA